MTRPGLISLALALVLAGQSVSLIAQAPSLETPSPASPAAPDTSPVAVDPNALDDKYRLNVGDQLLFRVVEDRDPSRTLVVLDTGEINFPYIGRIKAAGKTCRELATTIKPLLEKDYYHQATIILGLDTQMRVRGKAYLFGGVASQGPIDIPSDEVFTLSKAIIRAGGFAPGADRTAVRIERRTQRADGMKKETLTINLADVLDKGRTDQDPIIQANDLIVVPSQGRSGSIFISGEVTAPAPSSSRASASSWPARPSWPPAASRTLPTSAKSASSAPPPRASRKSPSISRPSSMRGAWTATSNSRPTTASSSAPN